jgi:hypothetical protein
MKLTLQLKLVPIKQMAGRQSRLQRWANHGLTKRLVQVVKDTKAALVLADLTFVGHRKRVDSARAATGF